jgi:hypothetical protein
VEDACAAAAPTLEVKTTPQGTPRNNEPKPAPNSPRSPKKAKLALPGKSSKIHPLPPNPAGFHANVLKHIGGGDEDVFKKVRDKLLEGEEVMDSFNVFMPTGMLLQWQVNMYIIMTCGLALFYFAFRALCRFAYARGWCSPAFIGFSRSVMVVTSYGRLLVWKVEAEQRKDGNMITYDVTNPMNPKNCLKACIDVFRISTQNYKLVNCQQTCAPPMSYHMTTLCAVYHLKDLRQLSVLSSSTATCGLSCCCPNFKSQVAMCFTGATDDDVAFDFSELNVGIESVSGWASTINSILNGDSDDHNGSDKGTGSILQRVSSPDVIYIDISTNKFDKVHEDQGATIVETLSNLATQILAHNKTLGPVFKGAALDDKHVVEDKNATIVHNDGHITIPAPYFPMLPGEQILQVHGQIFRPKFIEWIYTLFTFGFYYLFYIRPKRYNRTAFIITTHRISEIIVSQREGCVPNHGANYGFGARSFFPRRVEQHGFVSRSRNRVAGGIMTDFGPLQISFDMFGRRDVFQQFLKFFEFFVTNDGEYPVYQMTLPDKPVQLSGVEASIIRLQPGEHVVGRIQGTNNWRPLPYCEKICNTHCCPSPCYPWIPWLLCCSLRPKRQVSSIVVTNRVVYFMSAITNYTCNYFALKDSFSMSYAPVANFVGVSTTIDSAGKEWCARRMWQWMCCCNFVRAMFPVALHTYEVKGSVSSGAHVLVSGGPMAFHPIADIDAFDMVVARVQKTIWDNTPSAHPHFPDTLQVVKTA